MPLCFIIAPSALKPSHDPYFWGVRPGLVELSTRHDVEQDFASDACVLKQGKKPGTDERYLEEIAFEVVNEESVAHFRRKSEVMLRRGVRRIFGILVKKGQVVETTVPGMFETLFPQDVIQDPCLSGPIPVQALLYAASADLAVLRAMLARNDPRLDDTAAHALIDKGNPVITQALKEKVQNEEARGLRQAIADLCEVLDLRLTSEQADKLKGMDVLKLQSLRSHLKQNRSWPR